MAMDFKQLTKWRENLEKLNEEQRDVFIQACCKELAARLLAKVVKRTPSKSGTLRKGWTAGTSASAYVNSLKVHHYDDTYVIEIINPIEYASYVEYGHRTKNHKGWVQGRFMLTISEQEINNSTDKILQAKLNKFMKDVFKL